MINIGTRQQYKEKLDSNHIGNEPHNCPFCNILQKPEDIFWEGKYWYIIHNIFPYSGNQQHLMAIPKDHIMISADISPLAWSEFPDLQRIIQGFYGSEQYFSFTRETFAGRSLDHYHMHFLPGIIKGTFLRKMLELQGFPIQQELIF